MSASFDANGTIGALEIGVLVSCFLLGVVTVQTYIYYRKFPEDPQSVKLLVAVVWLFEVGHTICVSHALYIVTISQYGEPQDLVKLPQSMNAAIVFSGIIGPIVQSFFARRLHIISGQIYIPLVCWTLSLLRCVMSQVAAGEAFVMVSLTQYEDQWRWLLTSILVVGAVVDVTVAASLVYYLREHRKHTPFKRTAQVIDKLVLWTVQTGVITSIAAVVMLICFLTMQNNFVWLAIFMFLARLFSNSLLASLNARQSLRNEPSTMDTDILSRDTANRTLGSSAFRPMVTIEMTKTQDVITTQTDFEGDEESLHKLDQQGVKVEL